MLVSKAFHNTGVLILLFKPHPIYVFSLKAYLYLILETLTYSYQVAWDQLY